MKSKTRFKLFSVSEILLFILTNGLLVYFGNTNNWLSFSFILFICLTIFITLKFFQLKPIKKYFNELEKLEFHLTNKIKPYGIEDFYNLSDEIDQNARMNLLRKLLLETSKIRYLGLTGYILINKDVKLLYDELIEFLDCGKEIDLLLLSPYSSEKWLRNEIHGISELYDYFHIDQLIANYPDQVKIRFTNYSIYCSLIISDKELYYDPYHVGKNDKSIKNRFFSLRILKERGSYYNVLLNHYENLWKKYSENYQEFKLKNNIQA